MMGRVFMCWAADYLTVRAAKGTTSNQHPTADLPPVEDLWILRASANSLSQVPYHSADFVTSCSSAVQRIVFMCWAADYLTVRAAKGTTFFYVLGGRLLDCQSL